MPDRPFHNFRASKPADQRVRTTRISGFWGSKILKGSVGRDREEHIHGFEVSSGQKFHSFKASISDDPQILGRTEKLTGGFWGSKIVKCSVGYLEVAALQMLFILMQSEWWLRQSGGRQKLLFFFGVIYFNRLFLCFNHICDSLRRLIADMVFEWPAFYPALSVTMHNLRENSRI